MILYAMIIKNPNNLKEGFILRIDSHDKDKKIWIERLEDGEGGQFDIHELFKVIDKFYNDNF